MSVKPGPSLTEEEWLKCARPEVLLQFLARKRAPSLLRKLRLFGCAVCRRIEPPLPDRALKMVRLAEKLSDQDDLKKNEGALEHFRSQDLVEGTYPAGKQERSASQSLGSLKVLFRRDRINDSAFAAALLARDAVVATTGIWPQAKGYVGWKPHLLARWDKQGNEVRRGLTELLRHIIGNPFHMYPVPSPWPSVIVELAESLYQGEDCRLPLSDALEESAHTEFAEHFRNDAWHPRGCWALDIILRKG
jgi:hypothetical protein